MAKLALICHSCQHRYRAKRMDSCPKCGGRVVGPTAPKGKLGLVILLVGLALGGAYFVLGKTPSDLVRDAQEAIPEGMPGAETPPEAGAETPPAGK